jgi:hypothetical protein
MHKLMVQLSGLERFLSTEVVHDYIPDKRGIASVPDFAGAGSEVIAHTVQIDAAEASVRAFAARLAVDPRTPAPEISVTEDVDRLTYDQLSPAERRRADAEFVPINTQRQTPDSRSFAQQIRDAIRL